MLTRKLAVVAATATAVLAAVLVTSPAASAATPHKPVPHTKPTWIAKADHLGAAPAAAPVAARVYLAPQGGLDALKAAVAGVSTPNSASYHRFLTVAQFRKLYAPTTDSVAAVKSYLTAAGLRVTGVEAQHRYLSVNGTVAAAEKAFGTSIQHYQHDGQDVEAPSGPVTLPATIASSVLTVTGLDTTLTKMAPQTKVEAAPPAGFRNGRPCSLSYGQLKASYQADFKTPLPTFGGQTLPFAICGYTGYQFRAAYEGDTALDGSGVTVAIVDAYAAPTIVKDTATYAANHGDGAYARGQLTQTKLGPFDDQKDCDGEAGWYGEETLDIEAVHAMAPGANIHYYGAKNCFEGLTDALDKVVDDGTAQLVSNSYGVSEQGADSADINASEQAFLQGAMEGMSFLFSSGDDGDELANTGFKQADYNASDPYVTAVGGTATAITTDPNTGATKLAWETGWGTRKYSLAADGKSWTPVGFLYGSGGGASALFNQPSYQTGVVPGPTRQVPDVAMDADPTTGMLVGETQTFSTGVAYGEYRIGGTSLASPLFAGMTALALQHNGGKGAGLLNPVIYKNATTGAFMDVKGAPKDAGNVRVDYKNGEDASGGLLYSVRTFDQDSSLKVTRGWDNVTGVGTPTRKWLSALS